MRNKLLTQSCVQSPWDCDARSWNTVATHIIFGKSMLVSIIAIDKNQWQFHSAFNLVKFNSLFHFRKTQITILLRLHKRRPIDLSSSSQQQFDSNSRETHSNKNNTFWNACARLCECWSYWLSFALYFYLFDEHDDYFYVMQLLSLSQLKRQSNISEEV